VTRRESWRDVGRLEDFQDLPMERVSARTRLYESADDEHARRISAVMSTAVAVLVALRDASIRVTTRKALRDPCLRLALPGPRRPHRPQYLCLACQERVARSELRVIRMRPYAPAHYLSTFLSQNAKETCFRHHRTVIRTQQDTRQCDESGY
jgi:hypothetical protein